MCYGFGKFVDVVKVNSGRGYLELGLGAYSIAFSRAIAASSAPIVSSSRNMETVVDWIQK